MRSRFISQAFPLENEDGFKPLLARIKEEFHQATHHCYAYRLYSGARERIYCTDHGEPPGTAGKPILSVILRHGLTNTAVIVTRFFGGKKLGARGLIDAYGRAAQMVIRENNIVEIETYAAFLLRCDYVNYPRILKWLQTMHVKVVGHSFGETVELALHVNEELVPSLLESAKSLNLPARFLPATERPRET
ncbi:MAG: IMPACT family protein [Bacillota bacterium]